MSAGILCKKQLRKHIDDTPSHIIPGDLGIELDDIIGLSSLDLPIGQEYWEMLGSCRTGLEYRVTDIIRKYAKDERPKQLSGQLVLQQGNIYLFKIDCHLDLSGTHVSGKATARSSIGRLDVLARLLTNHGPMFDRVDENYDGDLYLEVTPITFDLIVKPGTVLSQLRLYKGGEHLFSLTNEALKYEDDFPVVNRNGEPQMKPCDNAQSQTVYPFCLDLTKDTVAGCSGFVAKKKKEECPDAIDPSKDAYYDPKDFWKPVPPKDGAISLDVNRLYILRSKERLRLPGHLALECQAYTETMGEWRIEYAGFAHPYFGSSRKDGTHGTPLMFEVRGHNIPTLLTDGIPLGNVSFKRMSRVPDEPKAAERGPYEEQELKLSRCFKEWSS